MDPTIGGVIITALTAIVAPVVVGWYRSRQADRPSSGWKAAVEALTTQVASLTADVSQLRLEVRQLEDANALKEQKIADRDRIIGEQSRAIVARDARIGQLVHAWPAGPAPAPDPAYARELGRDN